MKQRRPAEGNSTRLSITLPLPPSINEQYYTDAQGHRRLAPVALRYKEQVAQNIRHLERQGIVLPIFRERMSTCYLALYIEYYFETPFKRDLDNGLKITQDTLCSCLGANDNRIVDIHLSKRISPLDPHMYIEIDTLDDWEFDETYVLRQKK